MTTRPDIDALEEAHSNTTDGDWYTIDVPWGDGTYIKTSADPHGGAYICDCEGPPDEYADDDIAPTERHDPVADAAFIALAHNLTPALIGHIWALEAALADASKRLAEAERQLDARPRVADMLDDTHLVSPPPPRATVKMRFLKGKDITGAGVSFDDADDDDEYPSGQGE